ncbi:MAG: phage tail protein [Oceanospirillaceae bacterium]|nr:phage tail protein [Oceanospirillaceae bacterium]
MYMLGPFMFSRDTAAPQSITRTNNYEWAKQPRLGRESASQFTGIGDDTIELEGVIYPHYKGGTEQITLMRLMAQEGKPLMFVSGNGFVYGEYCIVDIEEKGTYLAANGDPRKVEFTLTLERYGSDDDDTGSLF